MSNRITVIVNGTDRQSFSHSKMSVLTDHVQSILIDMIEEAIYGEHVFVASQLPKGCVNQDGDFFSLKSQWRELRDLVVMIAKKALPKSTTLVAEVQQADGIQYTDKWL